MQIGWNIAMETTNGMVGLWTGWLGNGFKLFYPSHVEIPDEVIMKTLNVTAAKPVKNDLFGTRLWAKYYSNRLAEGGRVWIDQGWDNNTTAEKFYTIEDQQLKTHFCGYKSTNVIATLQGNFYSKTEPDAPNERKENIQEYKERFVRLLVTIAKSVGDITAIHLDSGLVLYTPEMLTKKGYTVKRWWEGAYKEYCYISDKQYEIMLENGNTVVPWVTVIRMPATNQITAEKLIEFVDKFDNSKNSFDPMPFIAYYAKNNSQ